MFCSCLRLQGVSDLELSQWFCSLQRELKCLVQVDKYPPIQSVDLDDGAIEAVILKADRPASPYGRSCADLYAVEH